MDNETVKVFGLILSIQADIEGMKAENMQRQYLGQSMAWTEVDFYNKGQEIISLLDQYEF